MTFFKRENNPAVFFVSLAFAISFLINSCVIVAFVVKNQNAEPERIKTLQEVKQDAFTRCTNDVNSSAEQKAKCGELLK